MISFETDGMAHIVAFLYGLNSSLRKDCVISKGVETPSSISSTFVLFSCHLIQGHFSFLPPVSMQTQFNLPAAFSSVFLFLFFNVWGYPFVYRCFMLYRKERV